MVLLRGRAPAGRLRRDRPAACPRGAAGRRLGRGRPAGRPALPRASCGRCRPAAASTSSTPSASRTTSRAWCRARCRPTGATTRRPPWPVQAVAARSYALATMKPGAVYDLFDDDRSQTYGGVASEDPRSNAGRRGHPQHRADVRWQGHHGLLLLDLGRPHRERRERLPRQPAAPVPGERARPLRPRARRTTPPGPTRRASRRAGLGRALGLDGPVRTDRDPRPRRRRRACATRASPARSGRPDGRAPASSCGRRSACATAWFRVDPSAKMPRSAAARLVGGVSRAPAPGGADSPRRRRRGARARAPARRRPPTRSCRSSEVTPGMVGEARTVVRGTDIVTFPVRILDVQRAADGPGGTLILARAEGPLMDADRRGGRGHERQPGLRDRRRRRAARRRRHRLRRRATRRTWSSA